MASLLSEAEVNVCLGVLTHCVIKDCIEYRVTIKIFFAFFLSLVTATF